jgi:hypothetical protein
MLSFLNQTTGMALSPDDRLLGEKVHYYCSSSEDDDDEEEDESKYGEEKGKTAEAGPELAPPEITDYKGYSTNVTSISNLVIGGYLFMK